MNGRIKFLGRLMTALEEKETLQIFQELERAKSTLSLAHDIYLESKRRHDSQSSLATSTEIRGILVQQQSTIESQSRDIQQLRDGMVTLTATMSNKPSHPATENVAGTVNREQAITSPTSVTSRPSRSIRSSNKQQPRILKVNPWFLSKIWQISLDRAPAGWDLKLRTWNVVPRDAPVLRCCYEGDLLGVQTLIEDGKASYHDVGENGRTLLSVSRATEIISMPHLLNGDQMAIVHGHTALVRHILQYTETWAVMWTLQQYARFIAEHLLDDQLYSPLFSDPRLDLSDMLVNGSDFLCGTWSPESATQHLTIILSNLSAPWEGKPLAERFEVAMRLPTTCACSTFRLALGPCSLEDMVDLRVDRWPTSAFNFAAHAWLRQLDHD